MMQKDPTKRFSDRVEHYARYRPGYPRELLEFFRDELSLNPSQLIADIGSGTGLLAGLFLENGNAVTGVEPNREMREAAEDLLRSYKAFTSIDATAEATTLAAQSIDLITAAQAFHWFDIARARQEFLRILKPGGVVALIWNNRRIDSPFSGAYEELVQRFSIDLDYVVNRSLAAMDRGTMNQFFGAARFREARFDNRQQFDFEGLRGRLLSSSYAPNEGHPRYAEMIEALHDLFENYQREGVVRFEYDTEVFYGELEI